MSQKNQRTITIEDLSTGKIVWNLPRSITETMDRIEADFTKNKKGGFGKAATDSMRGRLHELLEQYAGIICTLEFLNTAVDGTPTSGIKNFLVLQAFNRQMSAEIVSRFEASRKNDKKPEPAKKTSKSKPAAAKK